jgi:hypothetical protein
MRTSLRTFVAYLLLLAMGTAVVLAATQNYLAKYDASGTLVDSAVYESGGNVGIGSATPAEKLHVIGNTRVDGYVIVKSGRLRLPTAAFSNYAEIFSPTDEGAAYSPLQFTVGGGNALRITNAGNVGIGTTTPGMGRAVDIGRSLEISGGDSALWLTSSAAPDGRSSVIAQTYSQGHGYLGFYNADSQFPRVVLDRTGQVGIGTITPTAKLHVAGDVKVDGNIAAKYQDVAEWVQASESASPGTVVIADPDRANQVRPARVAYDTAVTGVVSGQAGILLGEQGIGTVAVSQSGRVRVKVDAGYGAIRPGDLLVTSPTAGYAMRSQPLEIGNARIHQPGTILGKALEPLSSGKGEVLVLLTLQ